MFSYKSLLFVFGLLTFSNNLSNKVYIIIQLILVWIILILSTLFVEEIPEDFYMSYIVNHIVFLWTVIATSVSLIETLRTSKVQENLSRMKNEIDLRIFLLTKEKYIENENKKLIFHVSFHLIMVIILSILKSFSKLFDVYIYFLYPWTVIKLRMLQMTFHLHGFLKRLEYLNLNFDILNKRKKIVIENFKRLLYTLFLYKSLY